MAKKLMAKKSRSMTKSKSAKPKMEKKSSGEHPAMTAEDARELLHITRTGAAIYKTQIQFYGDHEIFCKTANGFVEDTLKRLKTKDPLESMLVIQAIWAHARLARLTKMEASETRVDVLKMMNEACDRASNTFRKLMLTLAEYRRPPRSYTAIGQANVAQQQVVQNTGTAEEKTKNEKGSQHERTTETAALPANGGGEELFESGGPAHQAVAVHARTKDSQG